MSEKPRYERLDRSKSKTKDKSDETTTSQDSLQSLLPFKVRVICETEVKGKEDKVLGLLESNSGHSGFEVSFKGDDLSIVLPQAMLFDTNAAMLKFRLVTMIRDAVECGKISFVEVHEPRVIPDLESDVGDEEDLTKLSVAELKERLKAKGMPVGGKKAELIARLQDGEEE